MALPDSYTLKPGSVPAYFEAILNAEAPDRFTTRFLESLDFKSNNDRLFIGVLKELGFLDTDGVPADRYYQFLDRSQSAKVVADGIRKAYSELFAVNKKAEQLSSEEVRNKLRTLYKGAKKDNLIARIASTFSALCEYADFSAPRLTESLPEVETKEKTVEDTKAKEVPSGAAETETKIKALSLDSLQYHINIVLPDTRDQAVYDAIFKSLRDHLGSKQ
ncbi:MAG: DUF5343 domain-containing protein [Candidatus Hydrogenedentes bacterium]|nr:DUF5343 domain-containing protein [Candidatus Hydrogenedentota bacterium]